MTEYPVRRNPKTMIIVVTIIVILIVASYGFLTFWKPKFVVYTYSSFMNWGDEGAEVVLERAFAPFEEKYGIDIDFVILQADANFPRKHLIDPFLDEMLELQKDWIKLE